MLFLEKKLIVFVFIVFVLDAVNVRILFFVWNIFFKFLFIFEKIFLNFFVWWWIICCDMAVIILGGSGVGSGVIKSFGFFIFKFYFF